MIRNQFKWRNWHINSGAMEKQLRLLDQDHLSWFGSRLVERFCGGLKTPFREQQLGPKYLKTVTTPQNLASRPKKFQTTARRME
jgi:hypothetical protein